MDFTLFGDKYFVSLGTLGTVSYWNKLY